MLVNKTIQLNKDISNLNTVLARAKREFLKEVKGTAIKEIDFCKHYIYLKGILQDDLIVIRHHINDKFELRVKARVCTLEEHNEYLKKKWESEPAKRKKPDSYKKYYNKVI